MKTSKIMCRVVSVAYELEPGQVAADDGSGDEQRFRVRLLTADVEDLEAADVSLIVSRDELIAYPLGGRVYITIEPKDEANPVEKLATTFRVLRQAMIVREEQRKTRLRAEGLGPPDLLGQLKQPENEELVLAALHLAEEVAGGESIG